MRFSSIATGILWLAGVLFGLAAPAQAADDPVLRIEAGMHIAPIVAMATDAANRFVATGSEDKTVRLWSLPGGRPAAILRIPIGRGSVGKIYAIAVSPDGATVAVGGWTTSGREEQIYLLDSRSGALIRRLTGLPDVAASLAFSPDGRFLVAGLGGGRGIVAYDSQHEWGRAAADAAYGDVVHSLAFDITGRLATSSGDGVVRIYAAGSFERPTVTRHLGGRPDQLTFSPDARQLAVAFSDQPKVVVLSAADLSQLFIPDRSGLEAESGGFRAVTWSASGDVLMAGGSARIGGARWLRRWSAGGRGTFLDLPAANDTVRRLLPLRDGRILFATMDPALGVVTPSGGVHIMQTSGKLDLRSGSGAMLTANKPGDAVGIDVANPIHRLAVSLRDRVVAMDEGPATGFLAPRLVVPGLSVTGWRDGLSPAVNGSPLPLERSETARSLAIEPDGKAFALGTSWRLLRFNATGQTLWAKATEGAVWNVVTAADGRVVIAAQGDGTIRWRRASDGADLLALFVTPDARRWVAWTPSGYYDASPGGESLIGWQIGQGPDAAPKFHPAWQFRDRFYRPDVVSRILDTLDEAAALGTTEARAKGLSEPAILPVASAAAMTMRAPPAMDCDSPDETAARQIQFGCLVTPAPAVTDSLTIEATIDGHSVAPSYFTRQPNGMWQVSLVIPNGIPDKTIDVTLSVTDAHGHSAPVTKLVKWQGSTVDQKPTLHVLAVGVSKYPKLGSQATLLFPAEDARAFATAMTAQKGRLYGDVRTSVLTDEQATLASVKRRLRELRKEVEEQDVVMVFLSGHGAEPTRDWAFVPYDAVNEDEETQLSGEDLNRYISALRGIKVLFLDSCFSGAALRDRGLGAYRSANDKNRVINAFITAPTGVVVFSSSTGDQQSLEDESVHHGYYTAALLEGLAGKAGGPEIGMNALEDYLHRRVRALTRQRQTPTMNSSYGMPSLTMAIVDGAGP